MDPHNDQIIPAFMRNTAPSAQYALWNDGYLLIRVGDSSITLTPDDIRKLDKFMDVFAGEGS